MTLPPQPRQRFWVICAYCRTRLEFWVDPEGYFRWRDEGWHIQEALPDNTPDERELILNQMCGACFDKVCPPDDDE